MSSDSISSKILSFFMIVIMAFTIVPADISTWVTPDAIITSHPIENLAYASYNTPLGGTNQTLVLLRFEQNLLDAFQNHNNGVLTGTANYVPGKVTSYAFDFDGQTRVTLPNPSQFAFDKANPFSIMFYIKMPPNNSADMYIISNSYSQNSAGISIWKSHLSNSLTFKIQNTWNAVFQVSSSRNTSDNEWHQFVFSYDGSANQKGMRIYVDGALEAVGAPAPISGTIVTNLSETIGSTVSGSIPFVGALDNVKIINYLMLPSGFQNLFSKPNIYPPILSNPIPTKTGVSLSWLPVIGAVGYTVYRDGIKVTPTPETSASYFDSGLKPSTTHSYTVIAVNSTGGTSPPSKVNATTLATSLNPPLRIASFSTNITSGGMSVLKSNLKSGDGVMNSRVPYIKYLQDNLQVSGLRHFPFSPRIGVIDSSCNLGPVSSIGQEVTQSLQANQSGYYIDAIVYDIEGWCWTPLTEQQNYVSSIDKAAQIVHTVGFKFGIVPTRGELKLWYPNIHWKNIDYLFIQFHKSVMTKESGYTLHDPAYTADVTNIINLARSQNPTIKIFLNFSPNWEPVGSMVYTLKQFRNQIQGVNLYDIPVDDPLNIGSPYPGYNTPNHDAQFIKAIKSM